MVGGKNISSCLMVWMLIFGISLSDFVMAIPNPSAVYCEKMGYTYEVDKTQEGEKGICIVKSGIGFKAWDFLKGRVGKTYSYCAKKGYDIKTEEVDRGTYREEYAVCVSKKTFFNNVKSLFGVVIEEVRVPMEKLMDQEGESLISPQSYTIEVDKKDNITKDKESLGVVKEDNNLKEVSSGLEILESFPSSFDWRNYNGEDWVTSVKDQKSCGCCWAFSTVGAFEAKLNIDYNDAYLRYNLSEQQLVSCSGAGSCSGGSYRLALGYLMGPGVVDENCFPYEASMITCNLCSNWKDRVARITNYVYIPNTTIAYKQALIDYGPIITSVNATGWKDYDGGIFIGSNQGNTDHAVLLVGYNDTGNYWIIKNSWNTDWGENGYIRLSYLNNPLTTFDKTYAIKKTIKPIKKGKLEIYLINPTSTINVARNEWFNFSTGVRCVDGYCGDVVASLDPETELFYDDSIATNYKNNPNNIWAVRFTSPIYPLTITKAKVMFYNPNSVGNYSATLHVYEDDNGAVGDELIRFNTTIDTFDPNWEEINLNISINKKDFWIGITAPGNPTGPFALTDNDTVTHRSRQSSNGQTWDVMEKDLMIRAVVQEQQRITLFYDDFENDFGNWKNIPEDDFNWTRQTGITPSANTGPRGAYGGDYYTYTESSNPNYPFKVAILEGPAIDFDFYLGEEIQFWHHMYGSSMGTLYLEINDTGNWMQLWSKTGNQIDEWNTTIIDLSSYSGLRKLRFRMVTGSGFESDAALDNIKIMAIEGKSIIPMNNGTPFYTIGENPTICLNMESGQSCNTTWLVNATGKTNTEWIFYTIYAPINFSIRINETERVKIRIGNKAPISNIINNITVNETNLVKIKVNASDPDDDNIKYYINDSRFNQNNNIFTWQTPDSSVGIYVVNISVSDEEFNVSQLVTVTVNDVCIPNWIETNTTCRIDDTKTGYYIDNNSCYEITNLLSDLVGRPNNNTYECNYCSEKIQGPFYTDWTECSKTDSQSRIKHYLDLNYETCCTITGLDHDCHINNGTYNNITEIQSCNYCNSTWININSICGPEDYYNVTYVYIDDCCEQTGLESDCNIPENTTAYCNYCFENIIGPFNASCTANDTLTQYYVDENFETCCTVTNLESDCSIIYTESYQNKTLWCDYCTPYLVNTSWSNWINESKCLINDTNLQKRTRTQYDANDCGEVENITFSEYKPILCDYCTPNWREINESCQPSDTFIGWYNDTNNCYAITGLESDNNPPLNNTYSCDYCNPFWQCIGWDFCLINNTQYCNSTIDNNNCYSQTGLESDLYNGDYSEFNPMECDYCSEDIQGPLYTDWNDCGIYDNQTRTKYYIDNNYETCCLITGLESDCHINNRTYNNIIEVQSCNYCTSTWKNINSSCLMNDNFIIGYIYTNDCCKQTGLPSDCNILDNITAPCNYCSESIIGPFNTLCMKNDSLVQYYIDNNFEVCCAVTNLESDCGILYDELYHNKTLWCDYCTPSLVNTSWSEWINVSECYINNTILEMRNLTQYDVNYCDEIENVTYYEFRTEVCDYCTPDWVEVNTSCRPDNTIVGWYNDTNNCYATTGLESDLEDKPENNTYQCAYAYQYNTTLNKNWNLLSFPLNPINNSISSIFKNINFSSIFTYNGTWLYYYNETKNNFNTIDITKGYWINSLKNQTLTIEGIEFDYPINLTLTKGWNLVSYPSLNTTLINETLKDINYSIIYGYNGTWLSYAPSRNFNTLKYFVPGYGYWVNVNNDASLIFGGK